MTIPGVFKEYIWLIETIRRYGKISLAELGEQWKRRPGAKGGEYSRTTFNRHRDAIFDMFGLIIDCDRRDDYRYFIYNTEVLREDGVQNWLFSTMSVSNMLDENMALHDRILLESVPSAGETLRLVIRAMRDGRRIMLTYRRYGASQAGSFTAEPYCIKLFRRRWYVLAKLDRPRHKSGRRADNGLAVFSLDRVERIELLSTKFEVAPDFNASDFFDECFGVVVGDGSKPERIIVRAFGLERHYLRDLPLHPSQQEIRTTADYTDFEYFMRPTSDFKSHLLSRGSWLQVLTPRSLALEIRKWHQDAIARYDNCFDD